MKAAEQAILKAIETASVDATAPAAERFRFDPAALARVTEMFKRPGGEDLVIRAWHSTQRELFYRVPPGKPNDNADVITVLHLLQAHLALQDRLKAIRDLRYRETDQGLERVPTEELSIEDDPWLADRNRFPGS